MKNKKLTFLEFLEKSGERFGGRFDLSEVVWPAQPTFDKIRILCPEHGVILITPHRFLNNPEGCGMCGQQRRVEEFIHSKRDQYCNEFLKRATSKYGDKFDYSKIDYQKSSEKVLIICPEHGEFSMTPNRFLYNKMGCSQCGNEWGIQGTRTRLTHPDGWNLFIQKARKKFGEVFSFKKEEFKNLITPITITCSIHGPFKNTPRHFLENKAGCAKCALEKRKPKVNLEDFISRARERFGDKYDYSRAEFKTMKGKLLIICPEHGEFWKTPFGHLRSQKGCTRCAQQKKNELPIWTTKFVFLQEAKKKYGDFFGYSKVRREDLKKKITIDCPEHGEFTITPYWHLRVLTNGCPRCGYRNTKTEFVTFIHKARKKFGQQFDYSLFEWKGMKEKGIISCKKHGTFLSTPANHLSLKLGCQECKGEFLSKNNPSRIILEDFLVKAKKIHNDRYDYKKTRFGKKGQSLKITCLKHGVFKQSMKDHLAGRGCPICSKDTLRLDEKEVLARCREVHGEKYDYSRIEYKSCATPLKIRCSKHGFFYQTFYYHISTNGCVKCNKEKKRMEWQEKFIKEAENRFKNKFSYSAVRYESSQKKVKIRCPYHGYFEQTPYEHIRSKNGCTACYKETLKNVKGNIVASSPGSGVPKK